MTRYLPLCLLFTLACKTTETPKPEPVAAKPAPVVEAKPTPPPAPKVELPAPHPLPAMPAGLAPVVAPKTNPLTAEKADLGWHLFFDKRLSKDGSMACAQCHLPEKAYTTGNALDAKVGGAMNKRNAPSMLNLGFHASYYWDGRAPTLEAVSLAAWKGQLGADPAAVAKTLNDVPVYKAMFDRAFGGTTGATAENVPLALASFFRALNNGNSAFDKFTAGDKTALSKEASQGWAVFQKSGCAGCHVPPLFSDFAFHNVGMGGDDSGRKDATKDDADLGKLKTPSLRNVALTGPYFHDGSAATLGDAVLAMTKGSSKPNADPLLKPVKLVSKDLTALKAFLEALSGESTFTAAPELP